VCVVVDTSGGMFLNDKMTCTTEGFLTS